MDLMYIKKSSTQNKSILNIILSNKNRNDAQLSMKTSVRPSTSMNAKMATDQEANHNMKDQEKLVEEIVNQFQKKFVDRLPCQIVVKLLILHADKLLKVFVEKFHGNNVTRFRDTIVDRYLFE